LRSLAQLLGELSYPIYVIHSPLLYLFHHVAESTGAPRSVWLPAFLLTSIMLSLLLARYWDGPMREWLTRLFGVRRAAQQAG
jgi:peptidoglycan/LPS O-acetylase OafA/YrhL